MSQIKEYIKIAIMNIKHNRGRSVLTMLGIIIGISSVIMVLSIGGGVKNEIGKELEAMIGGQVEVYVDTSRKDTTVSFDETDIEALREIDHVIDAGTINYDWGTIEGPKKSLDVNVASGNTSLQYDKKEPIIKGRFFSESEYETGSLVGIITESNAKKLFGTSDVVGLSAEVTLYGISQEVTIIGIRQDSSTALINMLDGGDYVSIQMPRTALEYRFAVNNKNITDIYIYGEKAEYGAKIASTAKMILESRHNCRGENQILIDNTSDETAQFDTILSILTLFVSFVAAISLLVGGIGVMNIMLVSVTERTREIGIRKSLGARTKSIMIQFLAEAGIITLIGGIIGIILGVGGALLVCMAVNIKAHISWGIILLTTLFSCGVGLFFGIYPAKKAAKLRPIEALRHE